MKRILLTFSIILFCLIYWSCQKNETIIRIPKFQDPFVAPAVAYLKAQINDDNFRALDFGSIQTVKDDGVTTGISIANKNKTKGNFIFIEKIAGKYEGNWVEVQNKDSMNTGILTTTSFDGNFKSQVTFLNGRAVEIVKTDHNLSKTILIRYQKIKAIGLSNVASTQIRMRVQSSEANDSNWISLPDVTITVYKNDAPDILYSTYWMCPTPSYSYSYSPLPQSPDSYNQSSNTQASESGSSINTFSLNVISGSYPIKDIRDYFKCFTNVAGSSNKYKVTVCVEQPSPGKRTAWTFSPDGTRSSSFGGNPVNVGHTFLVSTQVSPTGTTSRNVGFYPQGKVNPYSPSDKGQLDDNEQHTYDILLTIGVNNSEFFNILNFVSQVNSSNQNYNLNNFNCTSFSIEACWAGDIKLPSTIGNWTGGSGNDPGDLGEDIRSMPLQSNMTRNTAENDHPNQGNCSY